MNTWLLIVGLILFVGLVVVHELGHAIAARRNGVEVEEFGIGFPPRVFKKKLKNKILFTINLLPLGGFVKLKGEHDADTEPGSYGAASLWAKTKIILAGIVMNLVVAWIMFTIVALMGMPKLFDNQFTVASDTKVTEQKVLVAYIEPDSPAQKAGLEPQDQLLEVSSGDLTQQIANQEILPGVTGQFAGKEVIITYQRNGETKTATTTLRSTEEVEASKQTDEPKGYLGISPTEYQLRRSTWSAPITGAGITAQVTGLTYKGLGTAVAGLFKGDVKQASDQVSGPLGVFVILRDGTLLGLNYILMIVAFISLTLAIINVLPIPALDGGRLFVTYLYRLLRKPLTEKAEELIHGIGFAALMVLFVLITIVDAKRFF